MSDDPLQTIETSPIPASPLLDLFLQQVTQLPAFHAFVAEVDRLLAAFPTLPNPLAIMISAHRREDSP